MGTRLTIAGLAGTGTSTLAKKISKTHNLSFHSGGSVMREKSAQKYPHMKDSEAFLLFEEEISNAGDFSTDYEIDNRIKEILLRDDNYVIESRLAPFFAFSIDPLILRILLITKDEIRFSRIAERENKSFSVAKYETLKREAEAEARFLSLYNISFAQAFRPINYNLIIDTSKEDVDESYRRIANLIS